MIKFKNSLPIKLSAILLAAAIAVGSVPAAVLFVNVKAETGVAKIGDNSYETLSEAINAAQSGENRVLPDSPTRIELTANTECGFDVGLANGSVTKNIELDLGGNTLTLRPAVGSKGTETNGIRVLAYSKLHIENGTLVCPDDEASHIKVGIANYGELSLENVTLKSGAMTIYTVNNRGKLTLSGKTSIENGKTEQSVGKNDFIAVTLDPYNLYYTYDVDASLICDSEEVSVGTVQIERYARTSDNKGKVKLDISAGSFDRIIEDGNSSVDTEFEIDGGTFGAYDAGEFESLIAAANAGSDGERPEKPVTIRLADNIALEKELDIGDYYGKEPKNMVFELNGKQLTLCTAGNTGACVRKNSKLCIKNGTVLCGTKYGIENDGELTLDGAELKTGDKTRFTVNNRCKLALSGSTEVYNGYSDRSGTSFAISVDPLNGNDAYIICGGENVKIGNVHLENTDEVKGKIFLDISNGTFGKLTQTDDVDNVTGIIGGKFASDVGGYIDNEIYGAVYDEATQLYSVEPLKELTDLKFGDEDPDDVFVGDEYTNKATSESSDGKVTYKLISGEEIAEINEETGSLVFKKSGKATVEATIAKTDKYKSATARYTVSAVRKDQSPDFKFERPDPTVTYKDGLTYTYTPVNAGGSGKLTYKITSGDDVADIDPETGELTIKKAGFVTVEVTKEADDTYEAGSAEYTLEVTKAEQEKPDVSVAGDVVYNNEKQSVLTVSGGSGDGELSYEIVSGDDVAEIDSETGEILTKKAGEITIGVTKAEDDRYKAITVEYTLTVLRAVPEFYVSDAELKYGMTEYEIKTDDRSDNDGKYTYLVGENDIGASVDENGKITLVDSEGKVGSVIVTVKRTADERYSELEKSFMLTVSYINEEEVPTPTVSGERNDGSEWYVGEAIVIPPEGWEISTSDKLNGNEWSESLVLGDDGINNITVYLKKDGNISQAIEIENIKIDRKAPENLEITYSEGFVERILESLTFGIYSSDTVTVTLKAFDATSGIDHLTYDIGNGEVTVNADACTVNADGSVEYSFDIPAQFRNRVKMTATDKAGSSSDCVQTDRILVVDTLSPILETEYSVNGKELLGDVIYGSDDVLVVFKIKEDNFDLRQSEPSFKVNDAFTALTWEYDGENGVWIAEYTLSNEGEYELLLDFTDESGNGLTVNGTRTAYGKKVIVDKTAPEGLKIEYGSSLSDKLTEAVSFGFYKHKVTVTVTANDGISGVDSFEWSYVRQDGVSGTYSSGKSGRIGADDITYDENGTVASATFTVDAQARGYITVKATDKAGNDTEQNEKNRKIIVVDSISPVVGIKYETESVNTKARFTDGSGKDVSTLDKATHAYYNGNIKATITVNEASFFEGMRASDGVIHNIGIKLTKTNNDGGKTVYEYLPEGSLGKYENAVKKYFNWSGDGDRHSLVISFDKDGDYVLELEYTDMSGNEADISSYDNGTARKYYKSDIFTVDKTAPIVSVRYGNTNAVNEIDGRKYFDKEQSVTVTVTEHNFRASDFAATVTAKNVLGNDVKISDFAAYMSNEANWNKNGDTHTVTVRFSADANYTFGYSYSDTARNAAAKYGEDKFTVDTTPPEKLTVTYSRSVTDRVLEAITFGYYNAEVTVTVSAEDETSGVYGFAYSYVKSAGVSDVNEEMINAVVKEADIITDGKKYSSTFVVPKDAMKTESQFNGTVRFTAYDRAENSAEKADKHRVIVDNIAPTMNVVYNEPVYASDGVKYYSSDIEVKLVINEANFYSEDVDVKVNGENVGVKWENESADVHNGTFKLTDDGNYTVTVEYTDRSDNKMESYTSERLTLDTVAPTVKMSGPKQNSANKGEKLGITITADDANINGDTFLPSLTVLVAGKDGTYEKKNVPFADMKCVREGNTYELKLENLADDGVYALVCTVKDLAGNTCSTLTLDDGIAYEEVDFSVNRNGSAFTADKSTDKLLEQYYVYGVNEDMVIEEVNTDPVDTYVVKLNGKELAEGSDYISSLTQSENEWSKRIYVISKDLFAEEGEYRITVESTDKAGAAAYSDVKGLNAAFTVDKTAPTVTVSGIENGGRYRVGEQTVTAIPNDDGGRLYSFKAVVLTSDGEPLCDENGNDISVRFEKSGDEFLTYLSENGGKVTFTVPEGLENRVRIICCDSSDDGNGHANEYNAEYTKVTVSQSRWVIYYANKPLLYGSIGGAVLALTALVLLIVSRKKKKKKNA